MTILVNNLKNLLWHSQYKCLQKISWNVITSGKDGFMEDLHCLEWMSISLINLQTFSVGFRSGEQAG